MFEIGRICIKTSGRDAGKTALVIDKESDTIVVIDGNVRRRKCNTKHLEPLGDILKIKKGASTSEVHKIMIAAKLKVENKVKVKRTKKIVDKKIKNG